MLLLAAGGVSLSKPPLMGWSDLLNRPHPKADRQIAYGLDKLNIVDLWLPKSKPPFPVVLMLHGGCWQTQIADRTLMAWIAADLRGRGIAVWNVEYRGVDRGGGYPAAFDDVAKAADLLAHDGAKYGLDTKRVVVIGHSAGGHLALWLADRLALPRGSRFRAPAMLRPAAAISQGGIPDLRMLAGLPDHCGHDGALAMAGKPDPHRPDAYADTSPPQMAQSSVPQFQVNGDQDRVAPPTFAADYARQAKARGAQVSSVTIPDSGHVELIAPGSAAWEVQVKLIRKELGLKP